MSAQVGTGRKVKLGASVEGKWEVYENALKDYESEKLYGITPKL